MANVMWDENDRARGLGGDNEPMPIKIALHCGGFFSHRQTRCQESLEVPLNEFKVDPTSKDVAWLPTVIGADWFVTVVTPPGSGRITFDILCPRCAPKVLPGPLYDEYKRILAERKARET